MKVRIKKWHGVAVWKWEIDDEVSYPFEERGRGCGAQS
jgi:hypothetical protein